ncbi:hypothetical protein BDY19DRAFT_431837 [Irpex rosettiformis]|uniref:Uncharacterized protein n=1 Tax=Irpex rosettiformis TaxID=378272 RepID=A0ACB8TUB3_9APHY|nr:hypothetical protein BDY19DRAFT_431837 [Irpex rosettiformis]
MSSCTESCTLASSPRPLSMSTLHGQTLHQTHGFQHNPSSDRRDGIADVISYIAQLDLQDIQALQAQAHTSSSGPALTDQELALALFAEEAEGLLNVARDHALDRDIDDIGSFAFLQELEEMEEAARYDHLVALALSQGNPIPPRPERRQRTRQQSNPFAPQSNPAPSRPLPVPRSVFQPSRARPIAAPTSAQRSLTPAMHLSERLFLSQAVSQPNFTTSSSTPKTRSEVQRPVPAPIDHNPDVRRLYTDEDGDCGNQTVTHGPLSQHRQGLSEAGPSRVISQPSAASPERTTSYPTCAPTSATATRSGIAAVAGISSTVTHRSPPAYRQTLSPSLPSPQVVREPTRAAGKRPQLPTNHFPIPIPNPTRVHAVPTPAHLPSRPEVPDATEVSVVAGPSSIIRTGASVVRSEPIRQLQFPFSHPDYSPSRSQAPTRSYSPYPSYPVHSQPFTISSFPIRRGRCSCSRARPTLAASDC